MKRKFVILLISVLFQVFGAKAQTNTDTILPYSDVMPVFKGGEKKMSMFINKNLRYPEKARIGNVQGQVMVRFIVRETGLIDSIKVIKSVSKECDDEVIRIIKLMPPFVPGMSNGKPVSVYFNLPVTFRLGPDN